MDERQAGFSKIIERSRQVKKSIGRRLVAQIEIEDREIRPRHLDFASGLHNPSGKFDGSRAELTQRLPRSKSKSSTFRSESGKRTENMTNSRMISEGEFKRLERLSNLGL